MAAVSACEARASRRSPFLDAPSAPDYFSSTDSGEGGLFAGVLLESYTGLAVAGIGVALFPVLKPHGMRLSAGYMTLRFAECAAIIAVGCYFLVSKNELTDYDLLVYVFSGAGGLVLSYLLLRSGLVARWLSVLGLLGYAVLLAGVASDLLGLVDINSGAGAAFYVPGGLFEAVLPLLLIFKGFHLIVPAPGTGDRDERPTPKVAPG
ncbi:DUF4386 domain-containing protein [Streptomyces sp. NBC_00124]|uniref:DUF4386 domain-containing protein n=1 Tax=Streptomyces sp. NBC_00124 TaxID=2975662 RepID=UPI002257FF83|nr:DUF4386 domain-containing protein [Streptomyces sp. NBC_00124]MCX5358120.1 DUF4386 domain-containing protein [Streptomyces sp. NBC_00124]